LSHQSLTEAYLNGLAVEADRASGVLATAHQSTVASSFGARSLSRPTFLGRDEHAQLFADLERLHTAITSLPDRLFGGDLEALARAVGMTAAHARASTRARSAVPSRLCRADLYLDATGFKVMEVNFITNMGGLDNALLNRAMLDHPYIEQFATSHDLTYTDTLAELVDTMLTECKVPSGTRPVMATVDWPGPGFEAELPQLRKSLAVIEELGVDAYPCHLGQLRYADGRVWLGDRRIDFVYRLFLLDHLLEEQASVLLEPLLQAVERDEVKLFVPVEAEVFQSKGTLALLSDDANRHVLTDAERDTVDRLVPWTRVLRPGPTTVDGTSVDLEQYVLAQRDELILKPMLLFGGEGIVPGWQTEPHEWRDHVQTAMGGPYIIQRRIHPIPELFPTDDSAEPWILTWGAFLMQRGAGGIYLRGGRAGEAAVVNHATGATGTCGFFERY